MERRTTQRVSLVAAASVFLSISPATLQLETAGRSLAAMNPPLTERTSTWSLNSSKREMYPKKASEPPEAEYAAVVSTRAEVVFDLSGLGSSQRVWAQSVLNDSCDFDWTRLSSTMNDDRITVAVANPPARGMYYPGGRSLVVHRYFYFEEREEASRILAWEAAHVVDIYGLDPATRQAIVELYHEQPDDHGWLTGAYEDQVGEAFMEGFVAAFCPSLSAAPTFSHETTPEIAADIRDLLDAPE